MTTPRSLVCTFCVLVLVVDGVRANPLGGTVVPDSGAASFSSSLGTLTINQTTPKVIINWQDFSIGAGEITRFVQPSASAAALNRVITANPSQIYGTLQANGSVYLINQNGILVGPSAQINVGSFLGSTLDFGPDQQSANASFLAGAGLRLSGDSTAAIRNEGYISALDDVFLIAHTVQNAGTISGHTVGLAAGAEIELKQAGTERLSVVAGNSKAQPGSADGVVNSGNIAAVSAELKAAGGNIYALAINNGGAIRATTIVKENGRILLRADRGTVVNSGTLDASNKTPGGKGGDVQVLGERVALVGNSKIDASGDAGGGTVLVGGDFQGRNADVPNAQRTLVGKDATIKADALSSGGGGKVIVWSEEATRYLGEISAKGAGNRGAGGFVEVSGKSSLAFNGSVDVAASGSGAQGTVLLDPKTITIAAANPNIDGDATPNEPGDDIDDAGDLDDAMVDFPDADSVITATAVNGLLTGNANLILAATERTTVNAAINGSGNASLTLNAPRVDLNAPITLAGSGVLSGNPSLVNVGAGGRIQNGVDVAAAGAMVNVAAGTYAENISVAKGLTLAGAKAGMSATTRDTSSGESIISGQVRLLAPGLTLDGFTVKDSAAGAGIVVSHTGGNAMNPTRIINNFITANVFGMSLASDGMSESVVQNNFFKDNTLPGSASRNGIYTDFSVSNVRVQANRFEGHAEGSATFLGIPTSSTISGISILDNTISGDGPVSIGNISSVTIRGNSIIGNTDGHAIWVGGNASGVSITENLLHNNGGAGLKFSSALPGVSSGFTVSGNSFQNNFDGAIVIDTSGGPRYDGVLNASGNWWGSATGPNYAGLLVGMGGLIIAAPSGNDSVDFSPWLNSSLDISAASGFQGNFSVLYVSALSPNATGQGHITEALGMVSGINPQLNVLPGTYAENVSVIKPVNLRGIQADVDARTRLAPESIIQGQVQLLAPGITFNGFTVRDFAGGAGIVVNHSGGDPMVQTRIINNIITDNVFGMSLASDGLSPTVIQNNFFKDNTLPGSASRNGIYTDFTVSNVRVQANRFEGHAEGSATFLGIPASSTISGISILDNTISGDGPISIGNISGVTIRGNSIIGNTDGHAIWVGGNASGVSITENLLHNNGGAGLKFSSALPGVSSGFTVSGNSFQNNFDGAIVIDISSGPRYVGVLDASGNWWGNASGPNYAAVTFAGLGNAIIAQAGANDSVDFGPWLNSGLDMSAASGFQGDFSVLNISPLSPKANALVGHIDEALGLFTGSNRRLQLFAGTYNDQAMINVPAGLNPVAVILKGHVALQASASINLGSTVDADGSPWSLNLVTPSTTLGGPVGNSAPLGNLIVSGDSAINGGVVTTSGSQRYDGAVTLGGAADTTLAGSTITFNDTVNAAVSGVQRLTISGNAVFGDQIGNLTPLQSLAVFGMTALNGGRVTTSGAQDYEGAVTLGAGNILVGTTVNFESTVNGTHALEVTGDASFGDPVGNLTPLQSLRVSGATFLDAGSVTTVGAQTYSGAVTLGEDTTLNNTTVAFGSTVNGGNNALTLNSSADVTVNGPSFMNVGTFRTTGPGRTILDGGALGANALIDIGDELVLQLDTTLTAPAVSLAAINGNANSLTVAASGLTTFGGIVSTLQNLTTDSMGTTRINTPSITTAGTQRYQDAVTLEIGTTLAGSTVTFDNIVNGAHALAVFGNAVFGNLVGNSTPLQSLGVSGTTALNGGSVTTSGAQDYDGAVTLGTANTLAGTTVNFDSTINGAHNFAISGNATFRAAVGNSTPLQSLSVIGTAALNGGLVATVGGQTYDGAVTLGINNSLAGSTMIFGSTINGARALDLSGNAIFGGQVGNSTPLQSLHVSGSTTLNGFLVRTSGAQDYDGAVTLATGNSLVGATVSFDRSVDGAHALSISANVTFGDPVGNSAPLQSLAIVGTTALNGGVVRTTGAQDYNGAVTLFTANTLAGTSVNFDNTVNGPHVLGISGNAVFGSQVGNSAALQSLGVSGTTALNGGAITTSGAQDYDGAVTLGTGNTLAGITVNFDSTVNGAHALGISGDATFGGQVGNAAALQSLGVSGTTALNGGRVNTSGAQDYDGAVTLGTGNILAGTTVNFDSTVNGAQVLDISGDVTFGDQVGNTAPLVFLGVSGAAALNGGAVNTSGAQSYDGAVTLGTANSLAASLVSFDGTVDGAHDLDISGDAFFGDLVGDSTALASLGISGTTLLNGGAVTTSGAQDYQGSVTLGTGNSLSGSTITFNSTVDGVSFGGESLTILGDAVFEDNVGGFTVLGSLDISGATTLNGSSIVTDGDQTYNGDVTLAVNNTLTGAGLTFDKAVLGSGRNLTIHAAGNILLNGNVTLGVLDIAADGVTLLPTAQNVTHSGILTVDELRFCAVGSVQFINGDNVIGNAQPNNPTWGADGGFTVVDSASAQFFTGTGKGSADATDFDESSQRIISSLVPQVQFQEIQADLGGVTQELEERAGILTRSTKIHFKSTEALTRSGEVR